MTRRLASALALCCSLAAGPLAAQVEAGDRAWVEGRFADARTAYERALATDPAAPRALYRLALLASWNDRLDSALALIRRARAGEPSDPDLVTAEARILAWDGRYEAALMRFDSVLAGSPDHREALLGRARTLVWAGRLTAADSAFATMLARNPDDAEALAGRAQLAAWRGDLRGAIRAYERALEHDPRSLEARVGLARAWYWRGDEARAMRELERALAQDPLHRDALLLRREIRAGHRPLLELGFGWTDDSEDNTNWTQSAAASAELASGVRAFAGGGFQQSSGATREDASRQSAELGLTWSPGPVSLTAAAGARRLHPGREPVPVPVGAGPDRDAVVLGTWRAVATWRFALDGYAGLSYVHYPLDETAFLIERGNRVDQIEGTLDTPLGAGLALSLGAGRAWLSDDNRRVSGVAALTRSLGRRLWVGALARTVHWDQRGVGYFAPDRFTIAELRAGATVGSHGWEGRLSGGAGAQWIDGVSQGEWHVEARIGRRFGIGGLAELFGGLTNSVANSTTGAGSYRYRSAGLRLQLGL